MGFADYDEKDWKVCKGFSDKYIELHAPGMVYLFNKKDFMELHERISAMAELIRLEELD